MESRKHTRLLARDDTFAELRGGAVRTGKISDISPGGLALSYLQEETSVDGFKRVDIYLTQNGFRLSDVPCTIVYDTIDSSNGSNRDTWHRCGLRFGKRIPVIKADRCALLSGLK